jgi:glycosyltransferase involved in cell wall biosynthesis
MSTPRLSVIVPVFNGVAHIRGLVQAALSIDGVPTEVIPVDDGSTDDTAKILREMAARDPRIRPFFLSRNGGAGLARNHGFAAAYGEYTLFFDADDYLHSDVVCRAIDMMDQLDADLAICPYRYERSADNRYDGMHVYDDKIWHQYIVTQGATKGKLSDFPDLLRFTNYPWNKVLRTATYRDAGLRFGSTKVNNDILGHWGALLHADRIVLINEVICTHIVHPAGDNLTNQHGRVRLQLVEALHETYDLVESKDAFRIHYSHHFWASSLRVLSWAKTRIPPSLLPEFKSLERDLLLRVRITDFASMLLVRDPSTARCLASSVMS